MTGFLAGDGCIQVLAMRGREILFSEIHLQINRYEYSLRYQHVS